MSNELTLPIIRITVDCLPIIFTIIMEDVFEFPKFIVSNIPKTHFNKFIVESVELLYFCMGISLTSFITGLNCLIESNIVLGTVWIFFGSIMSFGTKAIIDAKEDEQNSYKIKEFIRKNNHKTKIYFFIIILIIVTEIFLYLIRV